MSKVTLADALELSERLEKRGRAQQQALVDFHAFAQYKQAAEQQLPPLVDTDLLTKLAAVLRLDDVLVEEMNKAAGEDFDTTRACLMLNRQRGVTLLKRIFR